MTVVFINREVDIQRHSYAEKKLVCRWRQRLELVSTEQGISRIASYHKRLEEVRKDSSSQPFKRAWPCQHLDLKPLASRTLRKYAAVVSSHVIHGALL